MFRGIVANMKGGDACVVWPFISLLIIHYFQSTLFLWKMSLSFVEDRLSSVSPQGLCLLVGPTQGQTKTTAEKNKCQSTNMLIT